MKKVFFLWILLFPFWTQAGLDEIVLKTADQKCAIKYLTTQPLVNWYIQIEQGTCADGWLQDYAQVKLKDGLHQEKEILSGFFVDGYWLGAMPAKGKVQDRTNPESGVQALTFILGEDSETQTVYLAQVRANQPEPNRSYGAFSGCPDLRVLVVQPDISLFQNQAFQEKIAQSALQFGRKLCADLETVALFGSDQLQARAPDIVFQMQIDADTKEKTIIPLDLDYQGTNINHPMELRRENSEFLMAVHPQEDGISVHYAPPQETLPLPSQPQEMDLPITSLVHLNTLSRLSDKAVVGKTILHIHKVNLDGSGSVDLPQPAQIKNYPHLKIGWAVVQGRFDKNEIMVSKINYCQKEWCDDFS